MKCSMKCSMPSAPKEHHHPILEDLPSGTLFMPLEGDPNHLTGPGLITRCPTNGRDRLVIWLEIANPTPIPISRSVSRRKQVRVLSPGETVVLENK